MSSSVPMIKKVLFACEELDRLGASNMVKLLIDDFAIILVFTISGECHVNIKLSDTEKEVLDNIAYLNSIFKFS